MSGVPPRQPPDLGDEPRSIATLDELKAFLRANPGALDQDRELVSLLTPPAFRRGDNIVDMQTFMIARLKSQAAERKQRLDKIRDALAFDLLEERRAQKAAVAISSVRGFEALVETITSGLAPVLAASSVALNIERPESGTLNIELAAMRGDGPIRLLPPGSVARLLGKDDARVGALPSAEAPLFARGAPAIRSFVAARLTFAPSAPPGILAVGSKTAARFTRATGLHRYAFLARMIEQSVRLWLDLPPQRTS